MRMSFKIGVFKNKTIMICVFKHTAQSSGLIIFFFSQIANAFRNVEYGLFSM